MKYIVYGIVSAAILFLSVLMFLTVEGRTDHEKTLEEAVSLALAQTMQEQWMQAESIKDDEAWADAFCRILKEKMQEADIFCDATGVGMHPLEDLSNIPDPSYFRKDLIVTDTVYAPRETVMMKQAKEAGCTRVYNGMSMMLFQALIAIELYTGKSTPVDYMKEKLGI